MMALPAHTKASAARSRPRQAGAMDGPAMPGPRGCPGLQEKTGRRETASTQAHAASCSRTVPRGDKAPPGGLGAAAGRRQQRLLPARPDGQCQSALNYRLTCISERD